MINKNISIWRGTQTPPTNYHLWEKEDGGLYVYLDEKWQHLVTPTDKTILDEHQQQLDKIKNLALTEVDPTDTNTYKSYQLKSDDNVFGTTINIPKDKFIKQVTLGYDNATIDTSTGNINIGTGLVKEYLLFSITLDTGNYELISINLSEFITEKDYSDGLEIVDNKLKVKVDPNSEEYLKVTNNGIKVEGINTKVSGTVDDIKNKIQNGEWISIRAGRDTDGNIKDGAVAEGTNTTASAWHAHAEGINTKAIKDNAHAEGNSTTASGENAHAEGYDTIASGSCSHTEGSGTTASAANAHAEGESCKAEGKYSHAEGHNCTASGEESHAEGQRVTASGRCSHAEGLTTTAIGAYSHAEGWSSKAIGYVAHAEGSAIAQGSYSHAEGIETIVSKKGSHAQGRYNYDHAFFIDMVGIGNSDTDRKNASVIYASEFSNKNCGYQYLLDVGGYKGQWIGDAKSVQEVFADLENNKVDKVEGKSLVSDTDITKLSELPENSTLTTNIADAKKAGTDAQSTINTHIKDTDNPHNVTKAQVGLDQVNNTSDADKPISTATQSALDSKVDKVEGKQLSTNDYTTVDKNKVNESINESAASTLINTAIGKLTKANVGLDNVDNTADANKEVLSATKLKTVQTLWGQLFDGTASVTGNLIGVGADAQLNIQTVVDPGKGHYIHMYLVSSKNPLVLQNGYGNVGIGVAHPKEKFEVDGNIKLTGSVKNVTEVYTADGSKYAEPCTEDDIKALFA